MVWDGGRLQCSGDGTAGTQSGGPLQLLLPKIFTQDSLTTCGPVGAAIYSVYIYTDYATYRIAGFFFEGCIHVFHEFREMKISMKIAPVKSLR